MKLFTHIFCTIVLVWSLSISSSAQTTLYIDSQEADLGDIITVGIKTLNFNDILSAQFSVNWDSTALRFVRLHEFGIAGLQESAHFNTLNTSQGKLSFAWYDETLGGVTLADSAAIFTIQLEVISDSENTAVVISDMPTPIEVINTDSEEIEITTFSGTIELAIPTSTQNIVPKTVGLSQNSPNPFHDVSVVSVSFEEATPAILSLYDTTGKILFQKKGNFPQGTYVWKISRFDLPVAGIYYYQVQTERQTLARKLSIVN